MTTGWLWLALGLAAQTAQTGSYPGQEGREVKALSPEETTGYLEGRGMGLAKAAELNRYPGPRHVLELGGALELTPEQANRTQAVFDRMEAEARRLGKEVVEAERRLDRLFASGQADAEAVAAAVREAARLHGELRLAHLAAHLETRALLNGEQVHRYVRLRGYHSGGPHGHH